MNKVILSKESFEMKVEYILVNIFSFLFGKKSSSSHPFNNNFDCCSRFGNNFNSPPKANSILFFRRNISEEYKLEICLESIRIFIICFKVVIFLEIKSLTFSLFEFAIRHFKIEIYSINNFGLNLFSTISCFSK